MSNKQLPSHHLPNGTFTNPWDTWYNHTVADVIKFAWNKKHPSVIPSEKELPIVKPDLNLITKPSHSIQLTWIGHSTFLVQLEGYNVLTDPMFSERAFLFQMKGMPGKRIRECPIPISQLPKIHLVVVSHNHYDHLDYTSIMELKKIHDPWFCVPLRLNSWFEHCGITKVVDLDWWNSKKFYKDELVVTCLPAQHWSYRSGFDRNCTLWGSFGIECKGKKVYFAGDTGYCKVFKEIGEKYGPIDVALLPIGAYEPRWFMKYQHVDPEEAVQIALDIKAKKSIAMHWATFILTDEPIMEPKERLEKDLKKRGLSSDFFVTLKHGETTGI